MKNRKAIVMLLALVSFLYTGISLIGYGSGYEKDKYLSQTHNQNSNEIGLDVEADKVDVFRGVLGFTATPKLSGEFGESTGNGSFLRQPVVYSFDVFEGATTVNPGAGNLVGGQSLGVRLSGDPLNYPFDTYVGKFYTSAGVDGYNSDVVPLAIYDKSTSVPGFSMSSKYLSFVDEKVDADGINTDRSQGTGLIEWRVQRGFSTIFAAFLFGALMLVGAIASLFMTISVAKGNRPPSINSLTWLAAFLFALFQVRGQLPGDPPSGVRFDLFIFFPVILLLISLIMINVSLWNMREDWDMENPIRAIRGKRVDLEDEL